MHKQTHTRKHTQTQTNIHAHTPITKHTDANTHKVKLKHMIVDIELANDYQPDEVGEVIRPVIVIDEINGYCEIYFLPT